MGKAPTRKHTGGNRQRHNPSGLISVADAQRNADTMMVDDETDATTAAATSAAVPLINKMIAPLPGDRAWAAAGIANLVSDAGNRKLLLSKGLIDMLVSQIANEPHPEVLLEVTGAARNLVLADNTVANEFGRKGVLVGLDKVLTHCRGLLDGIARSIPASNPQEEEARKAVHPVVANVFLLLNALCTASKSAIRATSSAPGTLSLLLSIVSAPRNFPKPVISAAVALLEVLTEDNREVHAAITPATRSALVHAYLSAGHPSSVDFTASVAAAATMYNLRGGIDRAALKRLRGPDRRAAETAATQRELEWIGAVLAFIERALPAEVVDSLLPESFAYLTGGSTAASNGLPTEDFMMEIETDSGRRDSVPVEGTVDKVYEALRDRVAAASSALELLANLTSQIVEPGASEEAEWMDDDVEASAAASSAPAGVEEADMNGDDNDDEEMGGGPGDDEGDDDEEDPEIAGLAEEVGATELAAQLAGDDAALAQLVTATRSAVQTPFAALVPVLVAIAQWTVPAADEDNDGDRQETSNATALREQLTTLRVRALAVLNNVFFAVLALPTKKRASHPFPVLNLIMPVASDALPHAVVQQLYAALAQVLESVATASTPAGAEVAAMALGGMWGLLKNFDSSVDMGAASWVPVSTAQLQALVQFYWSSAATAGGSDDDDVRVKLVGLIGVLGKRQPGHLDGNRIVGTHLVNLLRTPSTLPPAVLAETLNALFDVYGDKTYDYDAVFRSELNGLAVLRAAVDGVKAVTKGIDRRRNRALRDACDEALTNLRGFIMYKQQEYRA
ncbi:hypothetical protein BC828DRAFT_402177 [Blastocladiella britannica]|nr:hypothetical protein BC828DRAFT_402177 [Blastocladiella britannica]